MHSNGEIIRQAYDAFGRGDMPTVFGILDKGIKWHVMGFFKKCMDLSQGTLRIDPRDIAATETSVFVLCTVSANRAGRHAEFLEIHLWRMINGHPVEFREFQGDEYTENKFWS